MNNVRSIHHFKTQGSIYSVDAGGNPLRKLRPCPKCGEPITTRRASYCKACASARTRAIILERKASGLCTYKWCNGKRYQDSEYCHKHSLFCTVCGALVARSCTHNSALCRVHANHDLHKRRAIQKLGSSVRIAELRELIECYEQRGDTSGKARLPELRLQLEKELAMENMV